MKIKILSKRGEDGSGMTMNQIITIILLITALLVILYWWFFIFKPIEDLNATTCYNSMVMRDTANFKGIGGLGTQAIPLRCKTEQVCYTQKGWLGKLTDEVKKNVEKDGRYVTCPPSNTEVTVKDKQELIADVVMREAVLWSMSEAGKLDYQPRGFNIDKKYCMIGNRITFDATIFTDSKMQINYGEVWKYMEANKVPNKNINFLQYLYGVNTAKEISDAWKASLVKQGYPGIDPNEISFLNPNQNYEIITSMTKQGQALTAVVGGASFLLVIVTAGTAAIPLTIATVGGGTAWYQLNKMNSFYYSPPSLVPETSLASEDCGDFDTLS